MKKFLTFFALACLTVVGAWAQGPADGYYQIVSADATFEANQGVKKALYFWNDGTPCWVNYRQGDPRQIFYIKQLSDGNYSIQDICHTKYYLSSGGKSSATQTTAQTFTSINTNEWVIGNTTDAAAYHCKGHNSGAGTWGNLTNWQNAAYDYGRWYLEEVTGDDLAHAQTYANGQQELKHSMMLAIEAADAAYDNATGTAQGDGFIITAADAPDDSQYWTNMPLSKWGSLSKLINGVNSDWFMGVPDGTNEELPYIGADLGTAVQNFYFKTANINTTGGACHPTNIVLLASNDKTNWKEVAHYTTELPTDINGEFIGKVQMDQAYRYLRFDFYENHNTNVVNQHNIPSTSPNISLAQLQIYPVVAGTKGSDAVKAAAATVAEKVAAAWALVRSEEATQTAIDELNAAVAALEAAAPHTYTVVLEGAPEGATVTIKGTEYANGAEVTVDGILTEEDLTAEVEGLLLKSITVADGKVTVVFIQDISAPVDFTDLYVRSVGEKTTEIATDKWYTLTQVRDSETPTMDNGLGETVSREAKTTAAQVFVRNTPAADVAKYLVRFIPTGVGETYRVQFGTENFINTKDGVAPAKGVALVSDAIEAYNFLIVPEANGLAFKTTEDGVTSSGFALDNGNLNPPVPHALNFWTEGTYNVGGNNVWFIYPVELAKVTADQMAREQAMAELIQTVETAYAANNLASVGDGLITAASQFSSPFSDSSEGKDFGALLDGSNSTFWHSNWHSGADVPDGPHYLQVDLAEAVEGDVQVSFTRRSTATNDHIVSLGVQTSTDGTNYEDLQEVALPFAAKGETVRGLFSLMEPVKSFRFFAKAMVDSNNEPQDRGYWHVADFQLNQYLAAPKNETYATDAAALQEALTAAKAITENPAETDIAALQAAYDAYLIAIGDKPAPDPYVGPAKNQLFTASTPQRGGWMNVDGALKGTLQAGASVETDATDANQLFALVDYEGKTYLWNEGAQHFLNDAGQFVSILTATPIYCTEEAGYEGVCDKTYFFHFSEEKNINLGGSKQIIIDDWSEADAGNMMVINAAEGFDAEAVAAVIKADTSLAVTNITWTITDGEGNEIATETQTQCEEGKEYTVQFSLYGVELKGETTVVGGKEDQNITLVAEFTGTLPVEYAATLDAVEHWYALRLHSNQQHWLYSDEGTLAFAGEEAQTDEYAWALVGDPLRGFQLYNKALGAAAALDAANPCTLSEDGLTARFYVHPTAEANHVDDGFCLKAYGESQYLNYQGGAIKRWGAADAGSTFVFDEIVDIPDGINGVSANQSLNIRYNLQGQQVGTAFRGIYLQNRKKVLR